MNPCNSLGTHGLDTSKAFRTINAARGNDQRPLDLEFQLRQYAGRINVKKYLSGAHLVLVMERVAIRAYYAGDLETIQLSSSSSIDENADDFDDMSSFFRSFRDAWVLFILSPNDPIFQQQLDDTHSHFQRTQRLASNTSRDSPDKNLRVLLLPDTETAIQCLIDVVRSMTPETKEMKKRYFLRLHEKHLVPKQDATTGAGNNQRFIPKEYEKSASERVAAAIRKLSITFDFPEGEDDVLISMMGSLENIVRADDTVWDNIPIERRTRDILKAFFGSSNHDRITNYHEEALQSPAQVLVNDSRSIGHQHQFSSGMFSNALIPPREYESGYSDLAPPMPQSLVYSEFSMVHTSQNRFPPSFPTPQMEDDWSPPSLPAASWSYDSQQPPVSNQQHPRESSYYYEISTDIRSNGFGLTPEVPVGDIIPGWTPHLYSSVPSTSYTMQRPYSAHQEAYSSTHGRYAIDNGQSSGGVARFQRESSLPLSPSSVPYQRPQYSSNEPRQRRPTFDSNYGYQY